MIDYCKQIFGKSIRDLTIEDLKVYFSEAREESEILEFKSGKGDFEGIFNKNILRTVSAFLNSSGGVLIWGAPEDKEPEKGMPKVCAGDLVLVKTKKEKDHLINRISSSISYMPTGIRVERLDHEDGYAYIIEVQESESKPHQLGGQYFVRLDGQSKPAPHYFVDSMFNQVKFPDLDGRIIFATVDTARVGLLVIRFNVVIFNKSPFINERNLSFQLVASKGEFNASRKKEYYSKHFPVSHYGRPIAENHTYIYSGFQSAKDLEEINFTLAFGGELGPAKSTYYSFDFSHIKNGTFEFKKYIRLCEESVSFKQKHENLGKTHEDSLDLMFKSISKKD